MKLCKTGTTARNAVFNLAVGVGLVLFAGAAPQCRAVSLQSATGGAAQQTNQPSDYAITRNIRRALIKNKSLSIRAHNVTIITKDGRVTLKGRVDSAAEKQTVESTAGGIAGTQNVQSQLTYSQ